MESMSGMTTTSSTTAPTATSTDMSGHDMGGMDSMHMDHGGQATQCVISMLWNWNTINSCFLSKSWHITSKGMFAGSCIGVICLVITLEFLRRIAREYDAFIIHRARLRAQFLSSPAPPSSSPSPAAKSTASSTGVGDAQQTPKATNIPSSTRAIDTNTNTITITNQCTGTGTGIRPTPLEQLIRAFLHMLQFAVAYFVMLLAMYFNGYIIICIFIGAFLGSFIFSWEVIGLGGQIGMSGNDATAVTKCCG